MLAGYSGKVFGPPGRTPRVWLEGELPLRFGWVDVLDVLISIGPSALTPRWTGRNQRPLPA